MTRTDAGLEIELPLRDEPALTFAGDRVTATREGEDRPGKRPGRQPVIALRSVVYYPAGPEFWLPDRVVGQRIHRPEGGPQLVSGQPRDGSSYG